MKKTAPTYIYFIAPIGGGRIKIGCSNAPIRRLMDLASWSPNDLELLAFAPGVFRDEIQIHNLFYDTWVRHEWFEPSDALMGLIAYVRRHCTLPEHAKANGPVKNLRAPRKKPSLVRTPEWRIEQGNALRLAWKRKREREASPAGVAA